MQMNVAPAVTCLISLKYYVYSGVRSLTQAAIPIQIEHSIEAQTSTHLYLGLHVERFLLC